jgi:hypothetical protein
MKNHALAEAVMSGRGVSVEVTGEQNKCVMLKGALKSINRAIMCNEKNVSNEKCVLTARIPPTDIEGIKQRIISAFEQCNLDITLLPEPNHEKQPLP